MGGVGGLKNPNNYYFVKQFLLASQSACCSSKICPVYFDSSNVCMVKDTLLPRWHVETAALNLGADVLQN